MTNPYPHERARLVVAALCASVFWLGLAALWLRLAERLFPGTAPAWYTGTFAIAVILAYGAEFLARAAQVAWLHGHAVEIGPSQYAELATRIRQVAKRLADTPGRSSAPTDATPRAFLLHDPQRQAAFGLKFLGESYLALNAVALDALAERPGAMDFHIGTALAQLREPSRRWRAVLFPATVLPLLGPTLARAAVHVADRYGLAAGRSPVDAAYAIAVEVSGTRHGKGLRVAEFTRQVEADVQGGRGHAFWPSFWLSVVELASPQPWPARRLARLRTLASGSPAPTPQRHPLAYAAAAVVPALAARPLAFAGGTALLLAWLAIAIHAALGAQRLLAAHGWLELAESRVENQPLALPPRLPAASVAAVPEPRSPMPQGEPYTLINEDLRLLGEAAAVRSSRQGAVVCEIDNRQKLNLHFGIERYTLSCSEPLVYTVVADSEFEPGRSSFLHAYNWREKRFLEPAVPPAPVPVPAPAVGE
jgi:hypothetical protein